MAISDSSKVDLLYKKLFGVAKTDTPTNKSPSNEAIASPHLTRGDQIWQQSANIPAIASAVTDIVQAYLTTDRIECVADNTSTPVNGVFPSWKTNLIDWIPSEFGSAYFVKVYAESPGNPDPTSGTPLSDSGIGGIGEWNFDYQSGVLNFIGGTIPAALTSDKVIYITGYRYIGLKGVSAFGNVTFGNISVTGNIFGNLISGNSYITSTEVKLQDISVAGNVISSLTTDLVFSANVTDPNNIIRFDSVSALDIPAGTTAQRPPNPDPGYVRYNSDITTIEWWNGTEWTAGSRLIEAETITPDGINQTFTLGQNTLPEGILVNINGTIQQAMSGAYTIVGDQITFSEIPEITDIIEIRYLSAGMTSASWYGGTIVNPVHITAMTPTTSATTGALTVHGGVGFGSNLTIAGNIIPAANTAYSLGDADHWWKSLYVSSNTIYINGIPLSVQADGTLLVNNAPVSASGSTYANSNVAAYLTSQDITSANIGTLFNGNASTQANLGAFQLYANANIGVLYNGNIATNANLGAYQTYANLSIGELQANLGSTQTWANANIASINANVGSFYTWANTNFGTSSYSNTNTAAYLVANPQSGTYSNTNVAAYLTTQTFYSNINVDAYIGANIGTLYNGNASTNANLGAFQTWANANAAGLSNQITGANAVVSMLQANVGSFYAWANNNFGTSSYSNANVSAYLVANPQGSTYSNTNVAAYLVANPQGSTYSNTNVEAYIGANVGAYQTYANANAATQATSINSLATGANANTAAYLATATITTTGNITAGNIITSGATSGNITNVNVISANSLQLDANLTVSGNGTIGTNLFVYGNLQVSGTTTTVNQATLSVTDKIITVSNGSVSGSQANGAGLSVAGANANIVYTSVGDQWNSNKPFYATALYDNSVRVVSTSSGAGNLTVAAGAVNLTAVGPGAVTTGSATAIPVITTDAYGRISAITTAAVSSTLNTAGNTGSGTVNLTSQSLTIAGTNGITAVASGQTVTVTDNLWPAANANIGTLFNGNATTNANLGAFQTYANANIGVLFNGNISTNANLGAFQLYANANIGTLFNGNITTNANLGAFQTYANSNAAAQATSINTINANVGAYQIYANANIGTLFNGNISTNANLGAFQLYANANIGTLFNGNISTNANLGAFQLYANANIGTLFNGNISTNANLGAYQTWANANAATQQTSINSLATNANTNTAAYLAAGISTNLTTTGNISATNVIVNGQPTTYGVVNPDYINAGRITSDQTGAGSGSDIIFNYAPVSSGISLNTSTGVFTLAAGKTYQLFAELSFSNFSDTANGYEIYDWVDATTNTRLVTTGIGAGIGENINRNTNEFNATSTTLIYTPTTNQTVKVRIVEAAGTVTVRAGIGTKAIIQQINPTIAVQATATGTVAKNYAKYTRTASQSVSANSVIICNVAESSSGTAASVNTSTGQVTLTAGTYRLRGTAGTIVGSAAASSIAYGWYNETTSAWVGEGASWTSPSSTNWNSTTSGTAEYVITVASTSVVSFRVIYVSNVTSIGGNQSDFAGTYANPWIDIEQMGATFALNALDTMSLTGALTASGDVSGAYLKSTYASGDEGGEIQLAKPPNGTLSGGITIDAYANRIRIFEQGGSARGAYIDLTQASAGVDTLLNNRVSAFVNAGAFVTMDNIKATVTTSGQRGLSLATVSGTASCYIGGTYGGSSVGSGGSSSSFSMTTTPSSSIFGWSFPAEGDTATYILNYTYTKSYRITIQIGGSYNNNMITIERLI